MAKTLPASLFDTREVLPQQICRAAAEPGVTIDNLTYVKCQVSFRNNLPSRFLQASITRESRWSRRSGSRITGSWSFQQCQPSSSFLAVLPQSTCRIGERRNEWPKQRRPRQKYSQSFPSRHRYQYAVMGAQGKSGNKGYSKVEVVEDDEERGDAMLEDQFNRFTMALALQDDNMAEKVMEEMGYSVDIGEMKHLVNEVNQMQEQLQELHEQVVKLSEEDEETARGLIEANHEMVMEQLESGSQGMEQLAMLDTLAQLRMTLGEYEESEYILDQMKDVMEVVGIDSLQPLGDRILEHMGSMYCALDKPAEGLPYYLKSVEIQEELLGEDSPLLVKTLLGLATTYTDMDESLPAIEVYKKVLLIIERTRGFNDEALALPLSKLGHCLLEEDRVDEAEIAMLRALKLVEQSFGANDGRVGVAKCALARAVAAREVDESITLYQEGLQIMERCSRLKDDDPSLETARTDLAELLNLVGRNNEAEKLWEKNLSVKENVVGPNDPSLVVHLQNLATSYAVSGQYEKCEPLLLRSLKLTIEDLGPDAPEVTVPLECLATALHHMGRQLEAEPLARRALEIREAVYGCDSGIVGEACNCLASILHDIGKYQEALTLMKRVLAFQEKELGSDSPELVLTLELIVMLLDKLGRIDEIEPFYMRLAKMSVDNTEDNVDDDVVIDI